MVKMEKEWDYLLKIPILKFYNLKVEFIYSEALFSVFIDDGLAFFPMRIVFGYKYIFGHEVFWYGQIYFILWATFLHYSFPDRF